MIDGKALITESEYQALAALVTATTGDVLEVGTFHGVTAARLAGQFPDRRIVSVDFWGQCAMAGNRPELKAYYILNTKGLPNTELIEGDSKAVLKELAAARRTFGVVFVDGDHSIDGAYADAVNGWPLVGPDGFLVFHDYDELHFGVRQGVNLWSELALLKRIPLVDSMLAVSKSERAAEFYRDIARVNL